MNILYFSFFDSDEAADAIKDFDFLQNWKKGSAVFNTSGNGPVLVNLSGGLYQDDFHDLLNRLYKDKFTVWIDAPIETA
jgi:hypothetical protein